LTNEWEVEQTGLWIHGNTCTGILFYVTTLLVTASWLP